MPDSPRPRWSYLRAAFLNAYNIASLAGVAVAGVATHDLWVLGLGAAAEAAWIIVAPGSRRFRRAIDARRSDQDRVSHLRRMQDQAALLPSEERQKVQALGARAAEIHAECENNANLRGEFMASQLERLDGLVGEYIHLAVTANRCETHLNRSDTRQISRDRDNWQRSMESAGDDAARELARKNLAILEKRLLLVEEMSRFVTRARGQMSLIQNTVALIRDEVMTMATPEALTVQLDELVSSVDAIREATREIESMVGTQSVPPPVSEGEASGRDAGSRVRT